MQAVNTLFLVLSSGWIVFATFIGCKNVAYPLQNTFELGSGMYLSFGCEQAVESGTEVTASIQTTDESTIRLYLVNEHNLQQLEQPVSRTIVLVLFSSQKRFGYLKLSSSFYAIYLFRTPLLLVHVPARAFVLTTSLPRLLCHPQLLTSQINIIWQCTAQMSCIPAPLHLLGSLKNQVCVEVIITGIVQSKL